MTPADFCKTCGGIGQAAFGNPHTKKVLYYDTCPNCTGLGWSAEAVVRDRLDAKELRDAVEFLRAKSALEAVKTKEEHKHLVNFQKYLDYLKANGKWDADLIKTWDSVSPRGEYEPK